MAKKARKLKDFEGVWQLRRRIENADGPDSNFEGQATWLPEGDGLRYCETGQLHVAGHAPMAAERRYFWAPDLTVYFEDGRFFHTVPPEGGTTGHWCDPDQYDVAYDFQQWPRFTVQWKVRGPRKNYSMISKYVRSPLT